MNFRLKTSIKCQKTLEDLKQRTNITPNILCRYAIGLSILETTPVILDKVKDNNGQEFNRQVLTGQYDSIFKALIIQDAGQPLSDEEYFPTYIKAHIERGVELLKNNYDLAGNREKFLINLARTQNGGHI